MERFLMIFGLAGFLLIPLGVNAAGMAGDNDSATVYRWQDQAGVQHYADTRPEGVASEAVQFPAMRQDGDAPPPEETLDSPTGPPPIAQELVREGEFALRLLEILNLGSTDNETEAISRLADRGISPTNGWFADFPVTPITLGEIASSIGEAARKGDITMDPDEARSALERLAASYGIAVKAGSDDRFAEADSGGGDVRVVREYRDYVEPSVVEYHYVDYGPPVVTYYSPPARYAYLYSWVDYPFWWGTYYFGGYFILHDFHVSHHHGHRDHHRHGGYHGDGHHGYGNRDHHGNRSHIGRGDRRGGAFERRGPATVTRDTERSFISNRVVRAAGDRITRIDPARRNFSRFSSSPGRGERRVDPGTSVSREQHRRSRPDRMFSTTGGGRRGAEPAAVSSAGPRRGAERITELGERDRSSTRRLTGQTSSIQRRSEPVFHRRDNRFSRASEPVRTVPRWTRGSGSERGPREVFGSMRGGREVRSSGISSSGITRNAPRFSGPAFSAPSRSAGSIRGGREGRTWSGGNRGGSSRAERAGGFSGRCGRRC